MNDAARNIILAAIVGDALGSAVDGFSKGHIRANFREIDDYIDPEPALKGKTDLWRKPGLYSSISQFMLICAMAGFRRGPCADEFSRLCAGATGTSGSDNGIFRNAGAAERSFIDRIKAGAPHSGAPSYPCARIIASLAPLSFRNNSSAERMADALSFVRLFTHDCATIAHGIFFSSLLAALYARASTAGGLIRLSMETAESLVGEIKSRSAVIFEQGVNPDALAGEVSCLAGLLSGIARADSLDAAEKTICSHVNTRLKTPVTRATVNLPAALLPYSLSINAFHGNGASLLFNAAAEGGSAAALTALTGAIGACLYEPVVPEILVRNLVNRRKILSLIDSLCGETDPSPLADDFIRSEASLTAKEQEELRARLKHFKKKPKKNPPSRADAERTLARHAVESWTKLDKARWKKSRKQMDKKDEQ
jgi:ADP-ribosylglycohydrolase